MAKKIVLKNEVMSFYTHEKVSSWRPPADKKNLG